MLRRTLAYDKFISELCVLDEHNKTQYIETVYTRALLIILINVFVNQRNTTYKIHRDCLTCTTHYMECTEYLTNNTVLVHNSHLLSSQ